MGIPTLLQEGNLRGHQGVPIDVLTAWFKQRMPEYGAPPPKTVADRLLVVKGETGSGKSTVFPVHLFRLLRNPRTPAAQKYNGRSVLCTQPRVLTATTIARDLAAAPYYPDIQLPSPRGAPRRVAGTVGYQTGPVTNMPPRGLVFATSGVLLAQLRGAENQEAAFADLAARYAFIIIDEAHERSLDVDAIFMALKRMLKRGIGNSRTPFVVLASATFDAEKYAAYFLDTQDPIALSHNVAHISGRGFPIETRWPAAGTNDYVTAAANRVAELHASGTDDPPDQQDILVFLPGMAEIRATETALKKRIKSMEESGSVLILIITRDEINSVGRGYQLVKAPLAIARRAATLKGKPLPDGARQPRRIILASVVAETGLTVETLKYVVDSGWQRASETYQPERISGLVTRPAPQSRIRQRKGRCGRLFPGVFCPLYTKNTFGALPPQQMPAIVADGIGGVLLDLAKDGLRCTPDDPALDLLDRPPVDVLTSAVEVATATGMLVRDDSALRLTPLGELAARLPRAGPETARLLFAAFLWGAAVSDVATIAAVARVAEIGLSTLASRKSMRRHGPSAADREAGARAQLAQASKGRLSKWAQSCDLILGLAVFEEFAQAVQGAPTGSPDILEKWCADRDLSYDALLDVAAAREKLLEELIVAGVNPFWGFERRLATTEPKALPGRVQALRRCMHDAWRLNVLAHNQTRSGRPVHTRADPAPLQVAPQIRLRPVPATTAQKAAPLRWRLEAPLVCELARLPITAEFGAVLPDQALLEPRTD